MQFHIGNWLISFGILCGGPGNRRIFHTVYRWDEEEKTLLIYLLGLRFGFMYDWFQKCLKS